ncbi:MAG: sigma-70 family RNA polymerase sigma factor [Myxococcota bacterium]
MRGPSTESAKPPTEGAPQARDERDRVAFEREVRPHREELRGVALRLTRSEPEADDVLQDALARAWAFWHRFEPGTNARAWMHRILYHAFVNRYRRRKREREVLGRVHRETAPDPHAGARDLERRAAALRGDGLSDEVRAALGDLRPPFREVVELVDLRGLTYDEAAQIVGCPVGTIMSRLHRARRALRAVLAGYARQEGYLRAA